MIIFDKDCFILFRIGSPLSSYSSSSWIS